MVLQLYLVFDFSHNLIRWHAHDEKAKQILHELSCVTQQQTNGNEQSDRSTNGILTDHAGKLTIKASTSSSGSSTTDAIHHEDASIDSAAIASRLLPLIIMFESIHEANNGNDRCKLIRGVRHTFIFRRLSSSQCLLISVGSKHRIDILSMLQRTESVSKILDLCYGPILNMTIRLSKDINLKLFDRMIKFVCASPSQMSIQADEMIAESNDQAQQPIRAIAGQLQVFTDAVCTMLIRTNRIVVVNQSIDESHLNRAEKMFSHDILQLLAAGFEFKQSSNFQTSLKRRRGQCWLRAGDATTLYDVYRLQIHGASFQLLTIAPAPLSHCISSLSNALRETDKLVERIENLMSSALANNTEFVSSHQLSQSLRATEEAINNADDYMQESALEKSYGSDSTATRSVSPLKSEANAVIIQWQNIIKAVQNKAALPHILAKVEQLRSLLVVSINLCAEQSRACDKGSSKFDACWQRLLISRLHQSHVNAIINLQFHDDASSRRLPMLHPSMMCLDMLAYSFTIEKAINCRFVTPSSTEIWDQHLTHWEEQQRTKHVMAKAMTKIDEKIGCLTIMATVQPAPSYGRKKLRRKPSIVCRMAIPTVDY